jgi:hypothetical protein
VSTQSIARAIAADIIDRLEVEGQLQNTEAVVLRVATGELAPSELIKELASVAAYRPDYHPDMESI